jgi:hypothetical protein
MKKKIFAYALITCMLGAAACGKSEENKVQATDAVEHDVSMQESKENNRDNDETNDVEEDTVETSNDTIIEETTTSKSEEESSATEVTENSEGTSLSESSSESEVKETEITETEDLEPSDEEPATSDEELSKRFFDKYYRDKTDADLEALMLERAGMMEESSFYDTAMQFWQEERGATDTSYKFSSLYYTDMRYYSEEDFKDVPIDIIVLAWNEIYARHGYRFKDENIENYFMGCLWYNPSESNEDFDENLLNDYEKHNLEVLDKLLK